MERHSKTNRFEKYPKAVWVLVFLLVMLVADFGLTGLYHLQKYGTIHKFADRRVLRERSPVFHHSLKKNGNQVNQKWGHFTHPIYTNSLGFKDRKNRQIPLESSNYRILFIGDSFTEGVGFEYDKTFVGLVDNALAIDHIEVLNAGVSSYSPIIYFKKVEYLLEMVKLDFDHLIVFLDISDIEDEEKRYELRDGRVIGHFNETSRIKDFVFEYTGLVKNIWSVFIKLQKFWVKDLETRRSPEEKRLGINQHKSLWTIDDNVFHEYGRSGLEKARDHMDLLYQLLREHRKEMSLAVYPWPDQIVHADLNSRQVTFWEKWATEHSVVLFNFFPSFISPTKNSRDVIRKNFIEGDVHWNEAGHKIMAQELYRKLRAAHPRLFFDN